jgi:Kdo2-lipid IVA lauroyltransferase/acyltransferase
VTSRPEEGQAAGAGGLAAGNAAARAAGRVAWLVRNAESVAYWLVVAPLAARLPARLAYQVACWRGDLGYRFRTAKRAEIIRNLRQVLGDDLGPAGAERVARDFFRMISCEVIDVMRLRGSARSLGKLVEIRGLEHLEAALAGGKGALICSAHYGSVSSAFSLLHAGGFSLTAIGRWPWKYRPGKSPAEGRFWDLVFARRLLRHRQRPNIEPFPGRVQVAAQAAVALRANEVVTISSDAPALDATRGSLVEMPFLGHQATLAPGIVTLARLTSAPVLMMFIHRSADYRHQVLDISPPVPMDGDTATAFAPCVTAIEAAIRQGPAEWVYWGETSDLAGLGLLSPARDSTSSSTAR